MSKASIVIFGEVLFDCFPDDSLVLGGAPFNVAWHIRGFGEQPCLISAIGNDDLGHKVLKSMEDWGLDTRFMQSKADHATGIVEVSFEAGEPHYDIKAGVAWDYIDNRDIASIDTDTALVYHGSLAAREACSAATLNQLAHHNKKFIDVNLRQPWFQPNQVRELIRQAYLVKLNFDELQQLQQDTDDQPDVEYCPQSDWEAKAVAFKEAHDIANLLITRGEEGATIFTGLGQCYPVSVPELHAPVVDTVGAGDAFSSVVLLGIVNDWDWPVILERAQQFAGYIVTQRGATIDNPSIYADFARLWSLEPEVS